MRSLEVLDLASSWILYHSASSGIQVHLALPCCLPHVIHQLSLGCTAESESSEVHVLIGVTAVLGLDTLDLCVPNLPWPAMAHVRLCDRPGR